MSAANELPSPGGAGRRPTKAALEYEHLSKKTRIELVGAKNDHNYNQPAPQTPPPRLPSAEATPKHLESPQSPEPEPEPAVEAIAGEMDDCMAAMVLMFLSTRPNEGGQPSHETTTNESLRQQQQHAKLVAPSNNNYNGQRQQTGFAPAKG